VDTRFAQAPASAEDFHRRTPSRVALDRALQLEDTRVLSNDWVIRYDTRSLQVTRQSGHAPARSTVLVRENAAGAIEIRYRGRLMHWSEIPAPPAKVAITPPPVRPPAAAPARRAWHPSAEHPWRRDYTQIQQGVRALARGDQ
jgi:hypothetical protein